MDSAVSETHPVRCDAIQLQNVFKHLLAQYLVDHMLAFCFYLAQVIHDIPHFNWDESETKYGANMFCLMIWSLPIFEGIHLTKYYVIFKVASISRRQWPWTPIRQDVRYNQKRCTPYANVLWFSNRRLRLYFAYPIHYNCIISVDITVEHALLNLY